jgi:hypothetical protein
MNALDPVTDLIKSELIQSSIRYRKENPDATVNDCKLYITKTLVDILLELFKGEFLV